MFVSSKSDASVGLDPFVPGVSSSSPRSESLSGTIAAVRSVLLGLLTAKSFCVCDFVPGLGLETITGFVM